MPMLCNWLLRGTDNRQVPGKVWAPAGCGMLGDRDWLSTKGRKSNPERVAVKVNPCRATFHKSMRGLYREKPSHCCKQTHTNSHHPLTRIQDSGLKQHNSQLMKQTSGKLRFFLISDLCGWLSALFLASVQIRSGSVQPGPHHQLFRQDAVQRLLFSIAVCLLHDVQLRTSNSALCSGIVYCNVTDSRNPSCVWRHICLPQHINYLSKAKVRFYVIIWLFRLQSGFNLGGQNIGFWLAVWMRPVAMQSRSRWHFGQSASSGPFHEKPWMTLIVSQRTFFRRAPRRRYGT